LSIPSVPKNEEKETEKHAVPSAVTQSPMSLRTPGKCRSSVRMSSLSSLRMSPLQLIAAVAST
uniref:LARP4 n=1 Tax=Gongylonema pulchrum TaxID=637853 RepID=A0A183D554_9BILA